MITKIRLRGRLLHMGSGMLLTLSLAVTVLFIFSVNLIPMVYRSALLPIVEEYVGPYSSYISLGISVLIVCACLLSYCALKMGSDRYMLKRAQNVDADASDMFYYFSPRRIFSLGAFSLRFFMVKLAIFLFFNIPTALCSVMLYFLVKASFSFAVSAVIGAGTVVFFLSSLYFYGRITASFFLVRYYYIKGEYLNFRHLLSSSQYAMKGKTGTLRQLKLSFLGWFMLCFFVLPIGYVWGYYRQTMAAFGAGSI